MDSHSLTTDSRVCQTPRCERGTTRGASVSADGASGVSLGPAGHLIDEAVVIRGGLMKRGDLIASAEKYEAQHPGAWAISVFSWPGLTAGEIARRARLPHVDLRKSTA